MVKIVRRGLSLAGLAAALALAACNPLQFLSGSIFPLDLPMREALTDLAPYVPPGTGYQFQASLAESATSRYVVLLSLDWSWSGIHLVVLDGNLKAVDSLTNEELDALDPINPFKGTGVLLDPSGNLAIGNRLFSVGSAGLSYKQTLTPALHEPCVFVAPSRIMSGIWTASVPPVVDMYYDRFDTAWVPYTYLSWLYSDTDSWDSIGRAFTDPSGLGDLFLLTVGSASSLRLLRLPHAELAAEALATPVMTAPSHPWFDLLDRADPLSTLDLRSLRLTADGFAGTRAIGKDWEMVLFDATGAILERQAATTQPWREQHLYGWTGGWYIFDQEARTIVRYPWWWK